MIDVLTPEQRRLNMSRIKGRDTKPELLMRRHLHAAGFRFRLHVAGLPGRPDIVLPKYRTAIFVHGCFWHGHDCPMFKLPATRREFWQAKITGNQKRDQAAADALQAAEWRVLTIWECSLRGPGRRTIGCVMEGCERFFTSTEKLSFLSGCWPERAFTPPKSSPDVNS